MIPHPAFIACAAQVAIHGFDLRKPAKQLQFAFGAEWLAIASRLDALPQPVVAARPARAPASAVVPAAPRRARALPVDAATPRRPARSGFLGMKHRTTPELTPSAVVRSNSCTVTPKRLQY